MPNTSEAMSDIPGVKFVYHTKDASKPLSQETVTRALTAAMQHGYILELTPVEGVTVDLAEIAHDNQVDAHNLPLGSIHKIAARTAGHEVAA